MTPLFVYGTLKKGGSNFRHIAHLITDVSLGWYVTGTLHNVGPYLGLVLTGDQQIPGELLTARSMDELLEITDGIEGHEYLRVMADVHRQSDPSSRRKAWVYTIATR